MFIVEIKFCAYYTNVLVPGAKLLEIFAMVFQPLVFHIVPTWKVGNREANLLAKLASHRKLTLFGV